MRCWRRNRTVQAIRRGFLRWANRDSDLPVRKRKTLLSPRTKILPCKKFVSIIFQQSDICRHSAKHKIDTKSNPFKQTIARTRTHRPSTSGPNWYFRFAVEGRSSSAMYCLMSRWAKPPMVVDMPPGTAIKSKVVPCQGRFSGQRRCLRKYASCRCCVCCWRQG